MSSEVKSASAEGVLSANEQKRMSRTLNIDENPVDKTNSNVQNSFSADSPYYESYVENEMKSMHIMNDTLRDIAARTKTFGKCGALMSESTRRLALACKLRRPYVVEDEKDAEEIERQHEMEVAERRRAVGEDMASLLAVMSEVSATLLLSAFSKPIICFLHFQNQSFVF
jgi:hypothetical protein